MRPDASMRLYLIRHGESVANAAGLVTGSIDTPLSNRGRQQVAELFSSKLRQIRFDHVFSSSAQRARETAAILFPEGYINVDAALLETDAGDVAEWTLTKFNQNYPAFNTDFDPRRPYPGGESHYDLYVRVNQWLDKFLREYKGSSNVALVVHGGPIVCVLHRALDIPVEQFPCCQIENASVTEVLVNYVGNQAVLSHGDKGEVP